MWRGIKARAWINDHLDDIASDLSALHRIDDWRALDGPRFFTLALRLWAYPGMVRALALAEVAEDDGGSYTRSTAPGRAPERVQHVSDEAFFAELGADWVEAG